MTKIQLKYSHFFSSTVVCLCVCAHLAINLTAAQGGLDDVEQSVRQAFALPHPPAGLFASRTHVPVWQGGKRQKQTHRQPEASAHRQPPVCVRAVEGGICTVAFKCQTIKHGMHDESVGRGGWRCAAKTPSALVCFLTSLKQLPDETSSLATSKPQPVVFLKVSVKTRR